MFLNNAVGHREAEAGAPALAIARRRLGSEEWIIDASEIFARNAAAGIAHVYGHAGAIAGFDLQGPAAMHGVLGVQEQVQEDLLQLAGVAVYGGQLGVK